MRIVKQIKKRSYFIILLIVNTALD